MHRNNACVFSVLLKFAVKLLQASKLKKYDLQHGPDQHHADTLMEGVN